MMLSHTDPAKDTEKPSRKTRQLTQEDVDAEVSRGRALIVVTLPESGPAVYDVTKWIHLHPGGEIAIRHFIGKDATDAMVAYHPEYVFDRKLGHFYYGRLVKSNEKPDKRNGRPDFAAMSKAYVDLERKIRDMGFYRTDYSFYYREVLKAVVLITGMVGSIVVWGGSIVPALFSATCGAILFWQMAFVAHDLGHSGVTHNHRLDTALGILLANFTGGLSLGWWKHNHNVHHIVTNDPVHDPDIQHLPFFAVSNRFFNNIYSTYYNRTLEFDAAAKVFVALQHHLYYIVLSFGRFNLYRLSWTHVLMHSAVPFRALELAGLVGFWFWFGTLLSRLDSWFTVAVYMIVSHCLTGLLHVQITLSHFGMDTSDVPGEDFATKALRTTMDVDCPEWLDWFHGGLQFQVAHHLFPRVPRHNLRKLRPLVAQFAKDHDLVYTSYHFVDGNKYVIGILKDVADQVKFIGNVIASESNQMAGEKRA